MLHISSSIGWAPFCWRFGCTNKWAEGRSSLMLIFQSVKNDADDQLNIAENSMINNDTKLSSVKSLKQKSAKWATRKSGLFWFNCCWLAPGNSSGNGTLSTKLRLSAQLVVLTQGYPKSVGGTFLLNPKGDLWGVKVCPPEIEQYVAIFSWLSVLHFSTEKPQIQPVGIKSDALEGPGSKIRVAENFY